MKTKQLSAFVVASTIFGGLWSCSADDPNTYSGVTQQIKNATEEAQGSCTISESNPDMVLELTATKASPTLRLRNLTAKGSSEVSVSAVVSFQGLAQTHVDLWHGSTASKEVIDFELPFSTLGLPERESDVSGVLHISVSGSFDDGLHVTADTMLLSFHWDASSKQWVVYDAIEKRERYANGNLNPSPFVSQQIETISRAAGRPLDVEFVPATPSSREDIHGGNADPESPSTSEELPLTSMRGLGGSGRFCFDVTVTYQDAGDAGEDYWPTTTYARPARGIAAYFFQGATFVTSLWLGDGLSTGDEGCTPSVFTSGTYTIYLSSEAVLNGGNRIETVDDSTSYQGSLSSTVAHSGSGTLDLAMTAGSSNHQMNVEMAASYSIWRHGGGMSQFYALRSDSSSGSWYHGSGDLTISSNHWDNKFVIVHEMGHAIGDFGTGGKLINGNVSMNSATCPATANDHSIGSQEWVSGAMIEGWGHFFAADVFNDDSEADCGFEYYKTTFSDSSPAIDCESGNSPYVLAYMENECGPTVDNRGVELDWLRQFWDVHTNGGGISFNTMLTTWINNANTWTNTTAYDELDAEANSVGGTLNANWDGMKSANGVDH